MDYCKRSNIVFGGYCPLAKGQVLTHPVILRLAKQYGKTPAQICIRWSIQVKMLNGFIMLWDGINNTDVKLGHQEIPPLVSVTYRRAPPDAKLHNY